MKFFATLWRISAIILTILSLITLFMLASKPDFGHGEDDIKNCIILIAVTYALSFSTIIRFVHKRVLLRGAFGKIIIGTFYFVLASIFYTIPLIGSIFGRIHRMRTTPEERRPGARYAEEVMNEINRDIWLASAKVAIDQIFDKEYDGMIRLDNGEEVTFYRQVSIVKSAGKSYVILSPEDEASDEEGVALIFAIAPYPGTDETSLVPVTNENLYRRIYSIYDSMLAEREIFD